jgi:energy-coupling factor transporter ATP-binding protein EcfA2
MNNSQRVTSVRFHWYKAFRDFSLSIDRFNILVGPNNAGKSTILGAFRILSEALRKARAKSPTYVLGPDGTTWGYEINLNNIPIATENVFHNYDQEHQPAVTFRVSNGNRLILFFPRLGVCNLICETTGKTIKTPSAFRQQFQIEIGFVPILGPVEQHEILYEKEAAREALLSPRASRNFRNIWHHYPDRFADFRMLIQDTWPGMDIKPPEVDTSHEKPLLRMFCPEDRIDREIFWAGFGFQVWCQMLTFMVANRESSLFIIDEPDIYLHSDLQRQLVGALRNLGPDILIATHSTEILLEADSEEILTITKHARSAKRVSEPAQLKEIFEVLGSSAKPVLTQVARSERVVFVEGKDFQVLSRFANRIGNRVVSTRSTFAVVPTKGFNPTKVKIFREGVEATTGSKIEVAVVFDRDYRSDDEVAREISEMSAFSNYVHIHSRKELENFLLIPAALERAITLRMAEQNKRNGESRIFDEDFMDLLSRITNEFKHDVQAQYLKRQHPFKKSLDKALDDTTITSNLLSAFEGKWEVMKDRLDLVPGKDVLSRLNAYLQGKWRVSITSNGIIGAMTEDEIPEEMKQIVRSLHDFATAKKP